jgi:polyisoprenoid-binding protein YceI
MVASVVLIPMTALLLGASFSKHTFSSSSSQISIEGSSNLHDWESQVTFFEGDLDFSSSAEGQVSVATGQLRIDVSSIKSNRGSSIMDKKTFKALAGDDFPGILFDLKSWTTLSQQGVEFTALAKGDLTITDKTSPIQFEVLGTLDDNGSLTISGEYQLLMSDYGIDAPTALMGTLKTGDEVTVSFRINSEDRTASN